MKHFVEKFGGKSDTLLSLEVLECKDKKTLLVKLSGLVTLQMEMGEEEMMSGNKTMTMMQEGGMAGGEGEAARNGAWVCRIIVARLGALLLHSSGQVENLVTPFISHDQSNEP